MEEQYPERELPNKSGYRTYCPGPRFSSPAPITTKTIVDIVDRLNERFGDGYVFNPEPITEGGIEMTTWPNAVQDLNAYKTFKTFRFHIEPRSCGGWPTIRSTTMDQWRSNPPAVIWADPKLRGCVFLKAFHGAPVWTCDEVTIVMEVLTSVGLKCVKSSLPSNKRMKTKY